MPGKEKSCLSKDSFDTRENRCIMLLSAFGSEMRRAGEFWCIVSVGVGRAKPELLLRWTLVVEVVEQQQVSGVRRPGPAGYSKQTRSMKRKQVLKQPNPYTPPASPLPKKQNKKTKQKTPTKPTISSTLAMYLTWS